MSEENLTIESTVENETDIYKELEQIAGIEDNRAFVEALKQFLKSKNYASKLMLEKCDFLLYAPGDIPDNARKELEQELKDIIL